MKSQIVSKHTYLRRLPPKVRMQPQQHWQTETLAEYLDRGQIITRIAPGVSSHVSEWDTLASRIDHSPEPYCADVTVSSWSVGSDVAATVQEFRVEREQ